MYSSAITSPPISATRSSSQCVARRKRAARNPEFDESPMTTRMELIQQTFIAESRELLRDMESALLRLESAPQDVELINAVFRAAHTIKGSSGTINFDAIAEFTHAMESVLQLIRSGELPIDGPLVALLLECGDHVSTLLDCLVASDKEAAFERIGKAGAGLLDSLTARLGTRTEPKATLSLPAHEPKMECSD